MLTTFSERLKVCRTITNLGIKAIVDHVTKDKLQLSTRQYSRWETNEINTNRIFKLDVIESIVALFQQNGLAEISAEWLINGKGMPPFLVDMSNALDEEKAFYIARAMGDDYMLTTIASNYAEPFASPGDQIITRQSKPEPLENKLAFIKTKKHKLHLGILKNTEHTVAINNISRIVTIKKNDIKYCGKLTWIS